MQHLIAAFLAQKNECSLPGLGKIFYTAASPRLDIANKLFTPPSEQIFFEPGDVHLNHDLAEYVGANRKIASDDAAGEIYQWSLAARENIAKGEMVFIDNVGTLHKNIEGQIVFEPEETYTLFEEVPAERVVHREHHAMLVGDRETTNEEMSRYFEGATVFQKNTWKFWALVLVGISIIIILFYFIFYGFSQNGVGNGMHITPKETPVTSRSF